MKTKNKTAISTLIAVTIAVSILVAFSATASATTYTVCSSGCDFTTIQGAIDAAGDSDTINVAAELQCVERNALRSIYAYLCGKNRKAFISPYLTA